MAPMGAPNRDKDTFMYVAVKCLTLIRDMGALKVIQG